MRTVAVEVAQILLEELKQDIESWRNRNNTYSPLVRASIESILGAAILLRIVIHSTVYSIMREPPSSTRWNLTFDAQIPEVCSPTRHEEYWMRMMAFFAAGLLALFVGPLISLSTAPALLSIVAANWLLLLVDPLSLITRGDNNG
jgi:hypothetical protein